MNTVLGVLHTEHILGSLDSPPASRQTPWWNVPGDRQLPASRWCSKHTPNNLRCQGTDCRAMLLEQQHIYLLGLLPHHALVRLLQALTQCAKTLRS